MSLSNHFGVLLAFAPVLAALLPAQQMTWTKRSPAASPAARYGPAMAYDSARGRVVLFGGYASNGSTRLGDTWEWDGTSWANVSPATSPPARFAGHAMAYDSTRQVIVLFGGTSIDESSGYLADTWEWNGSVWTDVTPVSPLPSPYARFGHAMAYDGQRVVMFGGRDTLNNSFGDTWVWNGSTWSDVTPISPAASPSARVIIAMAYDSTRGRVVMFGGRDGSYNALAETWEWNGSTATWSQRSPATNPPARHSHGMAYDSALARVVMFGGRNIPNGTGALADTWEWNGTNWIRPNVHKSPPKRVYHGMAYDAARGRTVIFGGVVFPFGTGPVYADTWTYALKGSSLIGEPEPASYTAFGSGCPGSGGTPALGADQGSLPWIGQTFTARLTNLGSNASANVPFLLLGNSTAQWGTLSLPLDLSLAGMAGCSLYTNPIATFALANIGGTATWSLPIPNDTSYLGVSLYTQGGVLSPGSNQLGIVLSNACAMQFGGQ